MTTIMVPEIEEETKLHPLLIPHIAKQIISYCTYQDLKNSREVCKLWNSIGFEYFKTRSRLRFNNFCHIDTFMSFIQEEESTLAKSNENLTFRYAELCRNVCLYGRDFQDWVILIKPFFTKFGSYIKSLDITHGIADITEDFMLQIAQHVDSLEELIISGTMIMSRSPGRNNIMNNGGVGFLFHPILPTVKVLKVRLPKSCFRQWASVRNFFIDFFSLFPNVQSISFIGYQFPGLFRYLPYSVRFPMLNSIHLCLFNDEGLQNFIMRNFRLTKLTIEVDPLLGRSHLHTCIEAFAGTLKHLDVSFPYVGPFNYSYNASAFPSSVALKKLQYFRLHGYFSDLYFIKDFPELTSALVEKMKLDVAFPKGTEPLGEYRKILKFYDENGMFQGVI